MLSQYSWGDFFKVILAIAVPYYAFVLWKYYREDIRDLILNRGKTPIPLAEATINEEEEDDQAVADLYTATNYTQATAPLPAKSVNSQAAVRTQSAGSVQSIQPVPEPIPTQDADLPEGHVIGEESVNSFDLPLAMEVVRPQEESLDTVIATAKTLTVDPQGAVAASDLADEKARSLADAINQQQGKAVFGGMSFTR